MRQDVADSKGKSIYLVRHGDAIPGVEDPARPLTQSGRQTVQRMAKWAAESGVKVDLILHSSKLRAQQTAEILAQYLQPRRGIASTEGLQPNDDVEFARDLILNESEPLMLVGHLPNLGRLVARLVADNPNQPVVEFDAAALVELVQRDDGWCIRCVAQPSSVLSIA